MTSIFSHKYNYLSLLLWITACFLFIFSQYLYAQQLDHRTQQDVIQFLDDYQPKVVSAEQETDLRKLTEVLADKSVVFVGERHDRYDHHLNQLLLLRLLHQQNPALTIGVEWFQQPFQQVLDDYLAGKINEETMLRQSGYYERWRYDFRLLRPILAYAKAHQLTVLALNAQTEITRKVSAGGLDSLSTAERSQIPASIHPPQAPYRDYLRETFDQHMGGQGDFERFVLIQRIWDETMAANIVQHLSANPQQQILVFAGSGHIGKGTAIPADVARSVPADKLVTLHSVGRDEVRPGAFDYFIVSDELSLPPTGKLGVWLEESGPDDTEAYVAIRELAQESAAAKGGMLAGDRFTSIQGHPVASVADLLMALAQTRRGQEVDVEFARPPASITDSTLPAEYTRLKKTITLQ